MSRQEDDDQLLRNTHLSHSTSTFDNPLHSSKPSSRARSRTITGETRTPTAQFHTVEPVPSSSFSVNNGNGEEKAKPESKRNSVDLSQGYSLQDRQSSEGQQPRTMLAHPNAVAGSSRATTGWKPPLSAFSRVPLSHLDPSGQFESVNVRDSVLTQSSFLSQPTVTSSSIYPQSTPPLSIVSTRDSMISEIELDDGHEELRTNETDGAVVNDFNGDDVSYRLRLLVNNKYFLPPAHAKPKPSDFAPPPSNCVPKKPPTPTNAFLDIFRRPRSKSAPRTSTEMPGPIVRTASDSTTATPRNSIPRSPVYPSPVSALERPVRVVVVREKMDDIAAAAKQAEQEMKGRGIRNEPTPPRVDDAIDPTDFVDVPPPSFGYPFAVQASAIHGLGVEESIGAALLADRLPPSSPSGTGEDWRAALLKAAVGHSFDSEQLNSPSASDPPSRATPDKIGLPIISNLILDHTESSSSASPLPLTPTSPMPVTSSPATPSVHSSGFPSPGFSALELPARVETPSAPLTPLHPPPRRQSSNPVSPIAQAEPNAPHTQRPPSSASSLRKATSTPTLADHPESNIRLGMTPPPLPMQRVGSAVPFQQRSTNDSSASIYSFDDDGSSRRSRASTSASRNSESGDPTTSPTDSTFQDALSVQPSRTPTSTGVSRQINLTPDFIHPPPRVSSSRFTPSAFQHRLDPPYRSYSEDGHWNYNSDQSRRSESSTRTAPPQIEIFAPEPTTPPLPASNSDRRGHQIPLSLRISTNAPLLPSIRSAPPPSSPVSFFDSLQSHLDLDDESSDESDDEPDHISIDHGPLTAPIRPFTEQHRTSLDRNYPQSLRSMTPQPRASGSRTPIMRLGNHSTPYVSRTTDDVSRHAVGNTPQRQGFFTEREPLTSTFELYQYAASRKSEGSNSVATTRSRSASRTTVIEQRVEQRMRQNKQRNQESLKRLDGMLKQHMQDEKDMIRRITKNSRSSGDPRPQTSG